VKIRLALATAGVGVLLTALPALAHHSFAAEYDASKPFTVKGTFVKMDWVNPHSWIHMDVKADDGTIQHWQCEALPPNGLYRQGWRKDSLKPGEEITVTGFKAKDGTTVMWTSAVTTADGRRMFAGSPEGPQGPQGGTAPGPATPTPPPAPPKE
jgi:Family of unknown function (DUF6152)